VILPQVTFGIAVRMAVIRSWRATDEAAHQGRTYRDPASGRDEVGDVFISDGKISARKKKADQTIEAKGHGGCAGPDRPFARWREPGFEYKRDLIGDGRGGPPAA